VPYQKFQNYLIKKGYLGNFNKDSCGIKILYGGGGRGYGGGGRICLAGCGGFATSPESPRLYIL